MCRNYEFNPGGCHPDKWVRFATIPWYWVESVATIMLAPIRPLSVDWSGDAIPVITSVLDRRLPAMAVVIWTTGSMLCIAAQPDRGPSQKVIASHTNACRSAPEQRAPSQVIRVMLRGLGLAAAPFLLASNLFVTVGTAKAERLLYLSSLGFTIVRHPPHSVSVAKASLSSLAAQVLSWLLLDPEAAPALPLLHARVGRGRRSKDCGRSAEKGGVLGSVGGLCLLVLGLSYLAMALHRGLVDWRSPTDLWASAIEVVPGSVHAMNMHAKWKVAQGNWPEALRRLRKLLTMQEPPTWGGPTLRALQHYAEVSRGLDWTTGPWLITCAVLSPPRHWKSMATTVRHCSCKHATRRSSQLTARRSGDPIFVTP